MLIKINLHMKEKNKMQFYFCRCPADHGLEILY